MNESSRIKKTYLRPAIFEVDHEWTQTRFGNNSHLREYLIERYIWRTEDLPSYRVAVGENLNTPCSHTAMPPTAFTLETRFLEYVPTGRIMYDNTKPMAEAVLFEYRLKPARDIRTVAQAEGAE